MKQIDVILGLWFVLVVGLAMLFSLLIHTNNYLFKIFRPDVDNKIKELEKENQELKNKLNRFSYTQNTITDHNIYIKK